ncbi:MAG: response regulator [Desulfobacteraceae bacterium]|nr:response regulator [Desulfobacteraceae bacterium]
MSDFNLTQHRITVLLVDDQPIVGEAMRRVFESEQDIDFHFCSDPTEALRDANRIHPTVILQDLVMPQIDGLVLVRYFRANKTTRDVPLIVLSSKEEALTKAEAFSLGANDYMVKFPDKLEVLARVRYHSGGYINLLQRNEAYSALLENQRQLEARNRLIRKMFGRYLSDEIVDTILKTPDGMELGGEKRKITMLMSDLRGFSSISESLSAESVLDIINIYLEKMTEIILKYEGTIDEFIGDGILVIFGAPISRGNDAQRAVACAMEMQTAMEEVNVRMEQSGYPKVSMGIGINTGHVVVGNIGSHKRTKYGVVGKNVNLTSRIESYTVGGQIFISASTLEECGPVLRIDNQMQVMPKGVKEPITIYEVGGIDGDYTIHRSVREKTELPELPVPIPVSFIVLQGKHAGEEIHQGIIHRLVDDAAEIISVVLPEHLSNLKIRVFDGEQKEVADNLYAKVIECFENEPRVSFRVAFTSVPSEAETYFRKLLSRSGVQS